MFSVEHNDGTSASYFDEKQLKTIEYEKEDMTDLPLWHERLSQRVEEVQRVLNYVHSHPNELGEGV